MSTQLLSPPAEFDWQRQPAAALFIAEQVDRAVRSNPLIAALARRLHEETGTRLVDWTDSLDLADGEQVRRELSQVGYEPDGEEPGVWRQEEGLFPALRLVSSSSAAAPASLAIKVESIDAFAEAWTASAVHSGTATPPTIQGPAGGQYRTAACPNDAAFPLATQLTVAERHGWRRFTPPKNEARQIAAAAKYLRTFYDRNREYPSDAAGFRAAVALFDAATADLGRDWACDLFFNAERKYWMDRNHAGQVQFARQERLGLGWGNHDHHTYRSSRHCFAELIAALVHMGFHCRERFYAGREAGWGAQVLEHSVCGFAIFADVDLTPAEVAGDFSSQPLPPLEKLGTVGVWCALHGEAFLQAGMHHLEAQFDFNAARSQLKDLGVDSLTPFTDWEHLRQAFTRGETWPVKPHRIEAVLAQGHITPQQAEQFRRDGAIGSHLEILERNDGFKGFNQTGISDIISRTDPRKWQSAGG